MVKPLIVKPLPLNVPVNGVRVNKNQIVAPRDIIDIYISLENIKDINIPIIYEDENIIIIDKSKHLETVSNNTSKQTVSSILSSKYPTLTPVHRLDTNTTGLLIFALNTESSEELLNGFKNSFIVKKYIAITSNSNAKAQETFNDWFTKDEQNSTVKYSNDKLPNSKPATLTYKKIEQNNDLALLEVTLITGRTHQIRAQLAFHKIFVLGDQKYGDKWLNKKYNLKNQCLNSQSIQFQFPVTSKLCYLNNTTFQSKQVLHLINEKITD